MKKILTRLFIESYNSPAQKTRQWLNRRTYKICASEVSGLIGKNPYTSPERAIKTKITNERFSNKFTAFGEKYEKIARDMCAIKKNVLVIELNFLIDNSVKFLGASPDGLCFDVVKDSKTEYTLKEIRRILEKKNIFINFDTSGKKIKLNFADIPIEKYMEEFDEKDINDVFLIEIKCPSTTEVKNGYIPKQYKYQMMTQMSVCQMNCCNFVNNKFVEIPYNDFLESKKPSGIILKYYDLKDGKNKYFYPELSKYYYMQNGKLKGKKNKKLDMMKEILMFITTSSVCNYELKYWILQDQFIIPYYFNKEKFDYMIEKLLDIINNSELKELITK
jgi:putative phage-type endonuclease